MKVLITDGNYGHTLGIVRLLGKEGISPFVISNFKGSLASLSKYCAGEIVFPSFKKDWESFTKDLVDHLKLIPYDILIPVGYDSFEAVSMNKAVIEKYTRTVCADYALLKAAASKKEVYTIAEKIKIPYPTTLYPNAVDDVKTICKTFAYPVVIKPAHETGAGNIIDYARDREELVEKYYNMCIKYSFDENTGLPLIQEYIRGYGCGFFALYEKGTCKRVFMHKRIREFPPSGGCSVCSKSIYSERLKILGMRLLDYLNWHGVAMVEFKWDIKDKEYKLLEINPKFWGSLDLALESGVHFPLYLCKMAKGEVIDYSEKYKKITYQWPFSGDFQHGIKNISNLPKIILDFMNPNVKNNICIFDFRPNWLEIKSFIKWLLKRDYE